MIEEQLDKIVELLELILKRLDYPRWYPVYPEPQPWYPAYPYYDEHVTCGTAVDAYTQ